MFPKRQVRQTRVWYNRVYPSMSITTSSYYAYERTQNGWFSGNISDHKWCENNTYPADHCNLFQASILGPHGNRSTPSLVHQ